MIVQGEEVSKWVMSKTGGMTHDKMTSLGWIRNNELVSGFVFDNWTGHNLLVHQRQDKIASRKFWKAVAEYCFVTLGCKRITGSVSENNEKALALNKNIGFEEEGRMKEAGSNGEDLILMVLWKDKCRMLNW